MNRSLTYLHKLYIICFVLYGLTFSLMMLAINYDSITPYSFLFYFVFYGVIMSFFMIQLEKMTLRKEGINTFDKITMDPNQKRTVTVSLTREEFYTFWESSKDYKICKTHKDGSIDIHKRRYTTEFIEKINVSYEEGSNPAMILVSKPKRWLHNNLALIHRTISGLEHYIRAKI